MKYLASENIAREVDLPKEEDQRRYTIGKNGQLELWPKPTSLQRVLSFLKYLRNDADIL